MLWSGSVETSSSQFGQLEFRLEFRLESSLDFSLVCLLVSGFCEDHLRRALGGRKWKRAVRSSRLLILSGESKEFARGKRASGRNADDCCTALLHCAQTKAQCTCRSQSAGRKAVQCSAKKCAQQPVFGEELLATENGQLWQ